MGAGSPKMRDTARGRKKKTALMEKIERIVFMKKKKSEIERGAGEEGEKNEKKTTFFNRKTNFWLRRTRRFSDTLIFTRPE